MSACEPAKDNPRKCETHGLPLYPTGRCGEGRLQPSVSCSHCGRSEPGAARASAFPDRPIPWGWVWVDGEPRCYRCVAMPSVGIGGGPAHRQDAQMSESLREQRSSEARVCPRGGECMTAKYGVPSVGTPPVQHLSWCNGQHEGECDTLKAAAERVVTSQEARKGEDVDTWAAKLAADSVAAGEAEYGARPSEAKPAVCLWSHRIGYDCELSEGHEGGHQATDLDGVSKVGWGSNHRAAYQRHCPSPADELTTEAEKLGMYWTNDARANDTSSPKSITTTAGVIPKCHFCDRPSTEVTWMVATDDTPSRAACNECIAACSEAVRIREAQRPDNPLPHAVTLTMGGSRTLAINDGRCIVTLMWNGEASMKSITETGQALVDNLKPRSDRAIHVPKTGEQTFWYEAGLEAGLARPCACEGVLRSETPLLADKASYARGWNAAVEQAAKTAEATQPVVSGYGGTSPSDYKTFYEPNPYAACCAANIRKLKTSPTGSEGDRG
jgi:hypothetical protein